MQLLIIAGRVGKDATLRQAGSDNVLSFSLAVDNGKDKQGNKREATWYDCSLWGDRGKALERHITKGSNLTLQGIPTVRVHEGKAYLGINVRELSFQGGGQQSQGGGQGYDQSPQGYQQPQAQSGYGAGGRPAGGYDLNDGVPFAPEVR